MKLLLLFAIAFLSPCRSAQNFTEAVQTSPFESVFWGSVAFADVDGDGDSDF